MVAAAQNTPLTPAASASGPSALSATPMMIFVSSLGSAQRVAHQRQNMITSTIVTVLTTESRDTSDVTGKVYPRKVRLNAVSPQTR